MRGYYIDGNKLSRADRISIDNQLHRLQYIYNSVPPLDKFTFYTEDHEDVSASLELPVGCILIEIQAVP